MRSATFQRIAFAAILLAATGFARNNAPVLTGDDAIAQKVTHEIHTYPYYTLWDYVDFQVDNGTVHLVGEVTQPWKKSALANSIEHIPGVVALDDEVKVAPLSSFDDGIRAQVARAIYRDPVLSRYAEPIIPSIHIIVDSGHVTLKGVVDNDMDKDIAGIRANSSLSFGMVTNDLRVDQAAPKHN